MGGYLGGCIICRTLCIYSLLCLHYGVLCYNSTRLVWSGWHGSSNHTPHHPSFTLVVMSCLITRTHGRHQPTRTSHLSCLDWAFFSGRHSLIVFFYGDSAATTTYFKHFLSLTKRIYILCQCSYGLRIIDLYAWEVSLSAFAHIYHTNIQTYKQDIPRSISIT